MLVYCPACGEWSQDVDWTEIQPGSLNWACSRCETEFVVEIGFSPQEGGA